MILNWIERPDIIMGMNDLRKVSIQPISRSSSRKSLKMNSQQSIGGQLSPTKRTTSFNKELKVELNDYQLYGPRRSSTFFTNGSSYDENPTNDEEEPPDYKEQFRRTILQMYAEAGSGNRSTPYADIQQRRLLFQKAQLQQQANNADKEHESRLYDFIKYLATEHEGILQFVIFLPLILTSIYIVFVEQKPLIT